MAASVGKRYVAKGGAGALSDGEMPLYLKDEAPAGANDASGRTEPLIALGKRYKSPDGEVELLVIKPGVCDLRYNGTVMELLQPKILPSAD